MKVGARLWRGRHEELRRCRRSRSSLDRRRMEKPKPPIDAIKPLPTSYYPPTRFSTAPFQPPISPSPFASTPNLQNQPTLIIPTASPQETTSPLLNSALGLLRPVCAVVVRNFSLRGRWGAVTEDLGRGGRGGCETWGRQKGEVGVDGERGMRVLQVPAPEVSLSPHL